MQSKSEEMASGESDWPAFPAAFVCAFFGFLAVWTIGCNLAIIGVAPFNYLYAVLVIAIVAGAWCARFAPIIRRLLCNGFRDAPILDFTAPVWELWRVATVLPLAIASVAFVVGVAAFFLSGVFWPLWLALLAAGAICLAFPVRVAETGRILQSQHSSAASVSREGLLFVGWSALVLALYFFISVPDGDDAFYLNLPIGMKQAGHGLLAFDTMLGGDWPLLMSTYRVESLPALSAAISGLTGIPAIYVAHSIVPAILCVAFAAVTHVAFRACFGEAWLPVAGLYLALLFVLDGSLQSYSAHGLLRLYHGKAALVMIAVPTIVVLTIATLRRKSPAGVGAIAVVMIASVGLTANALYIAPLAMGLVTASFFLDPTRTDRLWFLAALAATAYPLMFAGYLILFDPPTADALSGQNSIGADLWAVFRSKPLMLLALGAMFFGVAATAVSRAYLQVSIYALAVLIFVLNPFLWPTFAESVTGNLNYRLFWAIPLPFFLAIAGGVIWLRLGRVMQVAAVIGMIALLAAPFSILRPANGAVYGLAFRKVDETAFEAASRTNEILPRGQRSLSAASVAMWIPAMENYRYPIAVRGDYLNLWRARVDLDAVVERELLFGWVNGLDLKAGERETVLALLDTLCVGAIVLDKSASFHDRLSLEVKAFGGELVDETDGFEIYRREPAGADCES